MSSQQALWAGHGIIGPEARGQRWADGYVNAHSVFPAGRVKARIPVSDGPLQDFPDPV